MHSNEINKSLAQAINVIDDKNDRYTDLLDYAEAFLLNHHPKIFIAITLNQVIASTKVPTSMN